MRYLKLIYQILFFDLHSNTLLKLFEMIELFSLVSHEEVMYGYICD
jgi:hypothetical protein